MQRIADLFFLVIQWGLLIYGMLFFAAGAHVFFSVDVPIQGQVSRPGGDTYYVISLWQRFYGYTISALLALGLSGILFRLRHIYLRGRNDAAS